MSMPTATEMGESHSPRCHQQHERAEAEEEDQRNHAEYEKQNPHLGELARSGVLIHARVEVPPPEVGDDQAEGHREDEVDEKIGPVMRFHFVRGVGGGVRLHAIDRPHGRQENVIGTVRPADEHYLRTAALELAEEVLESSVSAVSLSLLVGISSSAVSSFPVSRNRDCSRGPPRVRRPRYGEREGRRIRQGVPEIRVLAVELCGLRHLGGADVHAVVDWQVAVTEVDGVVGPCSAEKLLPFGREVLLVYGSPWGVAMGNGASRTVWVRHSRDVPRSAASQTVTSPYLSRR